MVLFLKIAIFYYITFVERLYNDIFGVLLLKILAVYIFYYILTIIEYVRFTAIAMYFGDIITMVIACALH